ncbi:hypothetical protein HQ587_09340 [bacterium]|nr:hypothetical protein [bacterium]
MLKNLSGLMVMLLLIAGCARHPAFQIFHAASPEEAFDELVSRSKSLERFSAHPDFHLTGSFGKVSFKADIEFSTDRGWNVSIDGPLGIRIVEVVSAGDKFIVNIPHNGYTTELDIDQEFEIPEYDISFPDLSIITSLLLPLIYFDDPDSWTPVSGEPGQPGNLSLVRGNNEGDSLAIKLDYQPLRVHNQEFWQDGELLLKRNFVYNSETDYFPDRTVIMVNDLILDIKYKSVEIDFISSRRDIVDIVQ